MIKHRKLPAERKTVHLRARISRRHEDEIKRAAAKAGLTVSAWMVDRLLRAARREERRSRCDS